ncbi:beta-galactoside-binding lectin-like [Onthophagus taurus]|uniref:beta-galactoside-binding lectin-like n=1 Tax=Onthophagus taurus TaxID=166361 RepID=UPI000C20209C|nr:galectin-4-like [Onthophagus taurus]
MTNNSSQFLYTPIWGSKFKVRGIPDKDGTNIGINLIHHVSNQHIFHLNFHYTKNFIIFDTMDINNKWERQERAGDSPVRPGIEFEAEITCNKEEYILTINGTWTHKFKHRHNYLHADRLTIVANIVLLEVVPNVITPEPCSVQVSK